MAKPAIQNETNWEPQSEIPLQPPGSAVRPQQPTSDYSHRRKYERKDIQLDVSLYSDHNFYAGFTENLSAGGVFVATHNLLKIGETIDVTVTLPNDKQVVAHGVVRWLREYNEASDAPPGMGIQFLSMQGEDLMRDFLNARSPLFYDDE